MAVKFSDEQMQEIERLALINCNSNTIAEAVGVAVNTLKRHCGRKLRHWWAMYRVNLRESQDVLKATSPDLSKFLGKNVLGQVDKQDITTKEEQPISLSTDEVKELKRLAGLASNIKIKEPDVQRQGQTARG